MIDRRRVLNGEKDFWCNKGGILFIIVDADSRNMYVGDLQSEVFHRIENFNQNYEEFMFQFPAESPYSTNCYISQSRLNGEQQLYDQDFLNGCKNAASSVGPYNTSVTIYTSTGSYLVWRSKANAYFYSEITTSSMFREPSMYMCTKFDSDRNLGRIGVSPSMGDISFSFGSLCTYKVSYIGNEHIFQFIIVSKTNFERWYCPLFGITPVYK